MDMDHLESMDTSSSSTKDPNQIQEPIIIDNNSFPSSSTTTLQPPPPQTKTCSIKKFIFRSKNQGKNHDEQPLTILIPERTESSYGLYVWPSAHILAWFLYEHREILKNKKILELGAGTSLPGILTAFCGAREVILSDSSRLPHCLEQCRKSVELNQIDQTKVKVVGITWGLFTKELLVGAKGIDLVIGSDCFYDPSIFDDLLYTVAFILEQNPQAKFLSTYQERSSDWTITSLLSKWNLQCQHIDLTDLATSSEIDFLHLTQNHTIHLLEITLKK